MSFSVRHKIWFGTAFLFLLLILTSGVGIYFTVALKREAKAVLQDNYESVAYCHTMQQQMDSFYIDHQNAIARFDNALKLQERNVTEKGEDNATKNVRALFEKIKNGDTAASDRLAINNSIQRILYLNMNAIHNKNEKAQKTSKNAVTIIITLTGLIMLIAFTFSVNFPAIVTSPIRQLSNAIIEISNKNYKHRIHIDNKDEFGTLADAFNNMAERLEYFESSNLNKLMFEKSRAEAVINSLKDASIGIDKADIVLFANYQALQLLGLKSNDVVGHTVGELCHKNDLFNYLINNESTTPFKIVVDKRENYFIREAIDVNQGDGNSKVIVLRNITSFKELDEAKTNFIATISHELKTPLAASDLSLKLLEDERVGKLTEDQKELIQNLKHDSQRVLKILSELLNMSQVEAGRIQLDVQQVNPYLIVDSAIETVASNAKEKEINIKKDLQEHLPLINADAEKTTWVLNNFLTNAIKYSNEGGEITIKSIANSESVIFSVQDHGPGIAQEYLPRIFERYFQVPGSKAKGTGLGLAISKDFIEAQKGKIWAESEIGKGSTFNFSLNI